MRFKGSHVPLSCGGGVNRESSKQNGVENSRVKSGSASLLSSGVENAT